MMTKPLCRSRDVFALHQHNRGLMTLSDVHLSKLLKTVDPPMALRIDCPCLLFPSFLQGFHLGCPRLNLWENNLCGHLLHFHIGTTSKLLCICSSIIADPHIEFRRILNPTVGSAAPVECPACFVPVAKRELDKESVWDEGRSTSLSRW